MKKKRILALFLALLFLLSACGNGDVNTSETDSGATTSEAVATTAADDDGNAASDEDVTLTVGLNMMPSTFDLLTTGSCVATRLVFEGLFKYNPDTDEVEPWLAESYEYLDDNTMRIVLRDEVYFSNGEKLTAEDVLYSYERFADESNGSNQMSYYTMYDFDNSYAEDDLTVILATYEPYGPGIANLARIPEIVCKSFYENLTDEDVLWDTACGTGPYTLVENVSGSHTTLQLREDYWNIDNIAKVDTYIIKGYSEISTMFIDFEIGDLDVILTLDDSSYQRLLDGEVEGATVQASSELEMYYITLPEYVECFDDVRVREAFAIAVDWAVVAENAMGSLAEVATSNLSSGVTPYYQNMGAYEYDPDRAIELLEEAGYSAGDIVLEVLDVNASVNVRINETIQAYLAAVGIDMTFESLESNAAMPQIAQGNTDYFVLTGGAGTAVPEPALVMQHANASSGLSPCVISDEEYNSYWDAGLYSVDQDDRLEAYNEVQQWLHDNYRHIPIMETKSAYAYNEKVASMYVVSGTNVDLAFLKLA